MTYVNRVLSIFIIWCVQNAGAQDIQSTYEECKNALLKGEYTYAMDRIADAQKLIESDPNLDPNQVFANKLLPALEVNAINMGEIFKSLNKLYNDYSSKAIFSDLPASMESVQKYNQEAQKFTTELLKKREIIFNSFELEAIYRDVVRKSETSRKIEELASVLVVQLLSQKYNGVVTNVVDSLKIIDKQYGIAQAKLETLSKASAASKADIRKIQSELSRLSQERLNYVNALTQMLVSESSTDITPLRQALIENQVESVFTNMIKTETKRLVTITAVDSTGYRELVKEFERMQSYNQIFMQNRITEDKSPLLLQYQKALRAIQIKEPSKVNWQLLFVLLVAAGVAMGLYLFKKKADKQAAKVKPG
jgi:hypothetical protein